MLKNAYIIGLTGNIASGKSVIRRLLENSGALGIDADLLAQRTYLKGAPAFQAILDAFGEHLLDPFGEINRKALAQIVFSDREKLMHLEAIVHPLVQRSLDFLIQESQTRLIVIEAIKLFEIGFDRLCQSVWVSEADNNIRLQRLVNQRGMLREYAEMRLSSQPPQEEKLQKADVIIQTEGSFTQTWQQVRNALKSAGLNDFDPSECCPLENGIIARPLRFNKASTAAKFLEQENLNTTTVEDIMQILGQRSLFSIWKTDKLLGLISWQISNFTAVVESFVRKNMCITRETSQTVLYIMQSLAERHLTEVLFVLPGAGLTINATALDYQLIQYKKLENPISRSILNRYNSDSKAIFMKTLNTNGLILKSMETKTL
ncbi:MAG: dephospho-CoA kinase [Chloroflexota bacterium]